jgi:hypothetical protein
MRLLLVPGSLILATTVCLAQDTKDTLTYTRMKSYLDSVPAIDTHDHLWPFDRLPGVVATEHGRGMNLAGLWRANYFTWIQRLTPWTPGMTFTDWWSEAKFDFENTRAASAYRYMLPAFQDLYGVDFDRITDEQAARLNDQVFENYSDQKWLYEVVTERANIELMVNDPHWDRHGFTTYYPWEVLVYNVGPLLQGFHPSEFQKPSDDPYHFAAEQGLKVESLQDYLALLDRLFQTARDHGAVCLKTTVAYRRTLRFEKVSRERAESVFGRPRSELTPQEARDFEDFIMWHLAGLAAKYELPFQVHTGIARIQGSNPMLLVNLIAGNPRTKFILFHGGFPWIGETGVIVMRFPRRVWIDSVWLPVISYTTAKRAYHEWLEIMSSDRILWGADCSNAEGIYGSTEFTRRALAEVLAEKVMRGDLMEEHARKIGRQILRENALALFPQLKNRLWKHKGPLVAPGPNQDSKR